MASSLSVLFCNPRIALKGLWDGRRALFQPAALLQELLALLPQLFHLLQRALQGDVPILTQAIASPAPAACGLEGNRSSRSSRRTTRVGESGLA